MICWTSVGRAARWIAGHVLLVSFLLPVPPARAQAPPPEATPPGAGSTSPASEGGGFSGFLRDVVRDYRNVFSVDNARLVTMGGAVTTAIYLQDEVISPGAEPTPTLLKAGSSYGNPSLQVPLALTWWIAGHAAGSSRAASAGRDLVRAQISATSWTYALKYAVGRTRPNGDPRSFPSGHSSATFATAAVLQRHYGWKLGVPFYALATYTAAERVYDLKHWPSDVAFGAVVGILAGRTVTVQVRHQRISIEPQPLPGGGAVRIHVQR